MDDILIMDMLGAKMRYAAARQEVIAQNMANSSTPGYKRRDITKPNFKDMIKSSMTGLQTTNPAHIHSSNEDASLDSHTTVDVERESFEMMRTGEDFEQAAVTYKKMNSLMTDALGSNGS